MQRVTAAVTIAMASCFLVANEHAAQTHSSPELKIEAHLAVPCAGSYGALIVTVRLGTLVMSSHSIDEPGLIERWRETAEDVLHKQLHMA